MQESAAGSTSWPEDLPQVSVIMPVHNEGAFIARSLGAVLRQDYPAGRLEVLVADGGSTDDTRTHVARLAAAHPAIRVLVIDNPRRIVSTGMNAAMAVAQGEVVLRVDGHCEIGAQHVRRCVEHLERGEADGVGGPILTVGQTSMARVIAAAMSSRFGVGGSAFRVAGGGASRPDTIPFPAYRRAALARAGPYDEELVRNQDDEYNYRLRKLGARLVLAPDLAARYYSRSTLRSLARQYFQYGFWKVRVLQKHPRQMRARQFVPPAFVAAVAMLAGLAPFGAWARWGLALLGGVYALACAWAFARAANRLGFGAVLLPAACLVLHAAYGLGFLTGLIVFHRRWAATDRPAVAPDRPTFNRRPVS